jgi:FkbM family methyltransferase
MIRIPRVIARIPKVRGVFRLGLTAYARLFEHRYLIDRRAGLLLMLDQLNVIDWQILLSGTWEKPQLDKLFGLAAEQLRKQKRSAVFLDVGAHWGWYSLLAHKEQLFDEVIAVEPDPTNYGQLQANLVLNDLAGQIRALQLAASDSERRFAVTQRNPRNRGATRVLEADDTHPGVARGCPLDDLLKFTGRLLVLKIDVEGHELEAINGMLGLLSNNACIVQIEIWDDLRTEGEDRFQTVSGILERCGIKFHSSISHDYFFISESLLR